LLIGTWGAHDGTIRFIYVKNRAKYF